MEKVCPQVNRVSAQDMSRFCKICNKEFSSKQTLREHLYVHSGERPYKCTVPGCEESFRQGSLLSIHKRVHREIEKGISKIKKPYQNMKFPKLTSLICNASESIINYNDEEAKTLAKNLNLAFINEFL